MISKLDKLIRIKLANDLYSELMHEYKTTDKFNNLYTENEFQSILNEKIKDKLKGIHISIDPSIPLKEHRKNDTLCIARIMGPHYSDLRCMKKCYEGSEYCRNHLKRIDNYGYLSFGRYDQSRPKINEKGTKIPWRDSSPMEDINTIILYQEAQLKKLICNK